MTEKIICPKHGLEIEPGNVCFLCKEENPIPVSAELLAESITSERLPVEVSVLRLHDPDNDAVIQKIYKEAKELLVFAQAMVVTTLEEAKIATEDGRLIRLSTKTLEAMRKEYLAPFKVHVDGVNTAFKRLAAPLNEADTIVADKLLKFTLKQQEIQRQQEEVNELRIKAAQKEAALHNGEISESVVVIPVIEAPKHIRTETGMASETKRWKYRVVNFALLDDMWKLENSALLSRAVVSSKGKKVIPGIEAYQESSLTYR